jgi:type IV pilus assembly protein PilV
MGQSCRRGAAGFTMLEALAAIVVLAFGVLGVANLLIQSFRFAQQSSYDIVALHLANDMADRMRANEGQTLDKAFDNVDTETTFTSIADAGNLYKTRCTAAPDRCARVTAAFDLAEWASRVKSSLPGGRAVICRDASTYSLASGYAWPCSQPDANNPANTPLVIKIGWVSRFSDRTGADIPAGTTMPDASAANGAATPQFAMVVLPGVDR